MEQQTNTSLRKLSNEFSKNENSTIMGLRYNSLDELATILERMIRSKNIGVSSVEDALAVYMTAHELGLPFGMATSHMQVINGKPGIDIHIVKALLGKAGSSIWWTLDKDNLPLYEYAAPSGIIYRTENLPENTKIVTSAEEKKNAEASGLIPIAPILTNGKHLPYDYVTEYTFHREVLLPLSGKIIERTSKGRFTYQESVIAQLGFNKNGELDPNSAWYKYRRTMLQVRAFTYGARDIASDLLLGCRELTEVYDIENKRYDVTPEGTVTIVTPES